MKTPRELVAIANKCLVNDDPPNPPNFNFDLFARMVSSKDLALFTKMVEEDPVAAQFYRSKFFYMSHRRRKTSSGEKLFTFMSDVERNSIHSILCEGEVLYTEEF